MIYISFECMGIPMGDCKIPFPEHSILILIPNQGVRVTALPSGSGTRISVLG